MNALELAKKNIGKNVKVYTVYGLFEGKITCVYNSLTLDNHISIAWSDIAVLDVDNSSYECGDLYVGDWVEIVGPSLSGDAKEIGEFYKVSKVSDMQFVRNWYELCAFGKDRAWERTSLRKLSCEERKIRGCV